MENAFFSHIRSKILPYIQNAKQEVVIAMAWFTSRELFQSLLDCLDRGVRVEIILLDDAINYMDYAPDFNFFIDAGGTLRIADVCNVGFMHHKFCVVDNMYVITGSYNWTYYAENRNIENIIISDDSKTVADYHNEFSSLAARIEKAKESPRLGWNEISTHPRLNVDEINYEIENIAKSQNLPERKVIKSTTSVSIEEKPLNPISRFNIGIRTSNDVDNNQMEVIIPSHTKLPYISPCKQFYNYEDKRHNAVCDIIYSDGNVRHFITEKTLKEITAEKNEWELTIRIQFTLTQSGDLIAEVRCVESGKVMIVKASNPDFVDYED